MVASVNRDVQSFACCRLVSEGDGGKVDFLIFRFPHSSKWVTSFVTDTSVSLLFEILRHLLLFLSLQNHLWIVLTSDLFVTAFKHNNRIFKLSRGGRFMSGLQRTSTTCGRRNQRCGDPLGTSPWCLFGFSVVPPTLRTRHIPQPVRMSTDGTSHGFS